MAERTIKTNGIELCTESFGRSADPPILLIMGTGASMLWWEEGFCRLLAEGTPLRDPLRPPRHGPIGHL
jgi:pimeloyl-ACP methyl ester carboxylesterase